MITIIHKHETNAHDKIQRWRSVNQEGYLIVYRSLNNAMLHHCLCLTHLGDTDWKEGRINWGSLGNATKVCSSTKSDLIKWAKDNMKSQLKVCKHCNP